MVFPPRYSRDYPIWHPYSVSRDDLFDLSLAQLAKALPEPTSSHETFHIYLRWLEIHRRNPTKRTEHWVNTILHWTQSLHSRGFRESHIVTVLEDWKEANGPFHSQWMRYPPSPKDIAKVFDGMMKTSERKDRDWERDLADRLDRPLGERPNGASHGPPPSKPEWSKAKTKDKKHRQENFEGKPPGNYICNRCGEKGHHLQVCPTNLDPSYDKPPAPDYKCEICGKVGKHFKSLCPQNSDPYSIIQKRYKAGIQTPFSNKGRVYRESRKEEVEKPAGRFYAKDEEGRLTKESSIASDKGSSASTPSSKDEKHEQLREIEDKMARLVEGQLVDVDEKMAEGGFDGMRNNDRKRGRPNQRSRSSSRGVSPTSGVLGGMRKKPRLSAGETSASPPMVRTPGAESPAYTLRYNDALFDNEGSDSEMIDAVKSNKVHGPTEGCALYNNGDYCNRLDGCSYFHDPEARRAALEKNNNHRHSVGQKLNPDALSIDGTETDTSEGMDIDITQPAKQYSGFVQKLMQNRPEMNEIVNVVKRRPRAVDMWKLDAQRQADQMNDVPDLVQSSPPYHPYMSEDEENKDLSPTSNTSGPYARVIRVEFAQLDGAGDEKAAGESNANTRKSSEAKANPAKDSSSPGLHRKIRNLGKGAFGKVKELTTRGVSPRQASSSRTEELSPSKLKKTMDAKSGLRSTPEEDLNSLRVNPASSTLDLTEDNIKTLSEKGRGIVSHASGLSFDSLEVNLPGDRTPKSKTPLSTTQFAQYAGRQSLEAMESCEADCSEATQDDALGMQRATPASSDAAGLQNHALPNARTLTGLDPADAINDARAN